MGNDWRGSGREETIVTREELRTQFSWRFFHKELVSAAAQLWGGKIKGVLKRSEISINWWEI